ncbi:MAG: ABC transporter permease [Planctomycetota bacterium]|nr:ABC transporter permease [Planctomycetota bacterium]
MIRIAIRMLLGQTARWLGVVLGILLCTFLITHMLSMFSGMMRRSYALVSDIPEAEVWVMDPAVEYVDEPAGMPSTALSRVRGVQGVAWAVPLYTGSLRVRLPSGALRPVLLIGVDDATLIGAPRNLVAGSLDALRATDSVIMDSSSAQGLMRMPVEAPARAVGWNMPDLSLPTRPLRVGDEMVVNDHRLVVAGIAELTPRFLAKPVMYTTYSRAEFVTPRQRNLLSFVLVRAAPGSTPAQVADRIQRTTGLRARTSAQFADDTYWYYVRTTGVVARIALMIGIAVVVGISVSSLLLYLFTVDNARYYVTFKALGAGTATILRMVAAQALVSGFIGFGLGVGASSLLGSSVSVEAMPYALTHFTMLFAGSIVLLVCVVSALLSAMKVLQLDIGTVFKS